ncbi:pol-like protein [Colletotrichum camelliae]|nr:pol-like protein [Colletotrichum camelliae]
MDTQGTQWGATPNEREAQLFSMIESLQQQIDALKTERTARPRQVLPTCAKFNGRSSDWDTWILAMKAKLKVDGLAIGNDDSQLYYVYSSLDSNVQAMVLPFHLERIFDDPNKAKKAGQRLRDLEQRQSSLSRYLATFERTLYEANADSWPDDAKITALTGGLNKEVKQKLNTQLTLPTKYDDFIRVLLALEGQLHQQLTQHNDANGDNKENVYDAAPQSTGYSNADFNQRGAGRPPRYRLKPLEG